MATLGAAGLGACAVLAACSSVQVGAAAIVGSQRISQSNLDSQVANLQTAAKPYGSSIQLTSAQMPQAVLSWLIRFQVMDQVAAANGITVSQSQAQAGLASLAQVAQQDGASSVSELLVQNGVPPQLFSQVGRYEAQESAYATKFNGGKQISSQTQETAFENAFNKAQCSATKTLGIKVNPQYGRFDYSASSFSVVNGASTLSQPEGTPSPASTEGLTPAAC